MVSEAKGGFPSAFFLCQATRKLDVAFVYQSPDVLLFGILSPH